MNLRSHLWYHNAIEPIKIEYVIIITQKLVRNNKEEKNATIFDSIVSNTGGARHPLQLFLGFLFRMGQVLVAAIVILLVGWYLVKWICRSVKKAMSRGKTDAGVTSFVNSALKICLWIVLLLVVAAQLGLQINSIIAALGGHRPGGEGQPLQCGQRHSDYHH